MCGFHIPLVSFVVRYFKGNFQQDQMFHSYVLKKYCFVQALSTFQINIVRKRYHSCSMKKKFSKIKQYPCKNTSENLKYIHDINYFQGDSVLLLLKSSCYYSLNQNYTVFLQKSKIYAFLLF